jgi:hypothetical protein
MIRLLNDIDKEIFSSESGYLLLHEINKAGIHKSYSKAIGDKDYPIRSVANVLIDATHKFNNIYYEPNIATLSFEQSLIDMKKNTYIFVTHDDEGKNIVVTNIDNEKSFKGAVYLFHISSGLSLNVDYPFYYIESFITSLKSNNADNSETILSSQDLSGFLFFEGVIAVKCNTLSAVKSFCDKVDKHGINCNSAKLYLKAYDNIDIYPLYLLFDTVKDRVVVSQMPSLYNIDGVIDEDSLTVSNHIVNRYGGRIIQ